MRRLTLAVLMIASILLGDGVKAAQATSKQDGGAASMANEAKPVVYLTFDDGPNRNTDLYLALLAEYGVTATFFVTGNSVAVRPEVALQITEAGHAIGNHTWSHRSLGTAPANVIRAELSSTNAEVERATGQTMTCYRPPYGSTNQRVMQVAAEVGLTNAQWTASYRAPHAGGWDIDTSDYRGSRSTITRSLNKISGGQVILMHDIHQYSLGPLRSWLEANAGRFRFEPLPGCGAFQSEPEVSADTPERWYRFQIGRLYQAYFERYPDADGWEYWNTQFLMGTAVADMSSFFAESPEFRSTYGEAVDDERFVELVYRNVLDRGPDVSGGAFWLEELDSGLSRGKLMLLFAESDEFVQKAAPSITGDCWDKDVNASYACAALTVPGFTPNG